MSTLKVHIDVEIEYDDDSDRIAHQHVSDIVQLLNQSDDVISYDFEIVEESA